LTFLESRQVQALGSAQIAALIPVQLKAMTAGLKSAFSSTQLAYLSTAQFNAIYVTPLVLDLDGNGVATRSLAQGVSFDIDADGRPDRTGWVASKDGLLAHDLNQDGSINDGTELFGSATRLADGSAAKDGFEALAQFDTHADGWIDGADAVFQDLRVWVDANSDGVTDPGELRSLQEAGIRRISLTAEPSATISEGNVVGLLGVFERSDGSVGDLADVWFQVSPSEQLDARAAQLGDLLRTSHSTERSEVPTHTPDPAGGATAASFGNPYHAQSYLGGQALAEFARSQASLPPDARSEATLVEARVRPVDATLVAPKSTLMPTPPTVTTGGGEGDD